ncbi:PTS system mannose/fructose/sorbose family transporter subunit IID [Clostridium sp. Marseille-Q2269]|uniref:PTS system mannose/fructose/sorbose family transporter subunit IID n=1 Tax=Clostridium sp. Marseille-Q2269 TaxID=2942205 RepID=UPI0020744A8B|nr:PTS system mannose/fructose/sorbose family transporter subunit IID [Clostridium sp. Marseille-Q2269]
MNKKFSEKELKKISWRWALIGQLCLNYGKMHGAGYVTTMLPVIDKLYGDDEEAKQKALVAHSQYYNCTPHFTHLILGMDIAIEEQEGISAIDTVSSLKTSLMGPLSGIGDTIFAVMNSVVFGSIAATMAKDGNPIGLILWEVWYIFVLFFVRPFLFKVGYKQGANLISVYSDKLKSITKSISVLGLIVVGSMVASMVNIKLATIHLFSTKLDLQAGLFDKIMPKLPQALLAVFLYWLIGRKGMTTTKLILFVILIAIGLSVTGIIVP